MTNFLYKNDLPDNLEFGTSVAIDTETMGLNIFRDRLCLLQLSTGDGDAHLVQFEQNSYNAPNLRKLLNDDNIQKIFHFARFDLATIKYYLKANITNVYCTKVASKLIRTYTDAHGLKSLCDELLNIDLSKKQQSSNWGSETLTEKQISYAASDVLYLHQLQEILNKMLKTENRQEIFQSCMNFLPTRVDLDINNFTNDIFAH
jgi:ribonuclease D